MPVRQVFAAAGNALAGGLWSATPAAAHVLVQPEAGLYALSAGRLGAIVAALSGLAGAVVGGWALRRASGPGRPGRAVVALVAGLAGMGLGGLVVATAEGGLGTGNGLGGGVVALVVGLAGAVMGGLALARSRRAG
ncbi:hypothetical protein E1267_10645 [Nonomuraea longispora]|uniref:Uncharacterized protein n=1 Tax=Nonomuraea longispora TaxID=1848320 RepID=A0A4R4NH24_9ACTN|nr:DUF6223 family protein [Nonomuraea longispora]TDC08335.1 hypothetical protein E1267_10645 [Nonomuraea longispora]